jgi:hypothetical protein
MANGHRPPALFTLPFMGASFCYLGLVLANTNVHNIFVTILKVENPTRRDLRLRPFAKTNCLQTGH